MVQQLDKNMSNLRTWLSRIEGELAKPITYSVCHSDEIQRKLSEQQVHTAHTFLLLELHHFYPNSYIYIYGM